MNLAEIKEIFSSINLETLNVTGRISTVSDARFYDNLGELKRVILLLSNVSPLKRFADNLKNSELFAERGGSGSIAISPNLATTVDENLVSLFHASLIINRFLLDNLPTDKDDSIRIKLPPVRDFEDIAKVMNDLKKAISIPLAEEGIGQVVVEHGEAGSIWLFVYLGARRAVKLIAELGWAAMVILNKKNELNYVAEQIKAYKMGEE